MRREECGTIEEALKSIRSLDELEGFIAAIRNPDLKTMEPTEAEWRRIAVMKIEFQKWEKSR